MFGIFRSLDQWVSKSRPLWLWVGAMCLVTLGTHLAADRLDDLTGQALSAIPIPWPTPETPLFLGTWVAVAVELFVVLWAAVRLWVSSAEPATTLQDWWMRQCAGSITALVSWAPLTAVGAWVVAMAVEDALSPYHLPSARPAGWVVAVLVTWRLGWFGIRRVTMGTPTPASRLQGIWWSPPVLVITALALRYGLPVHGWWA